LRFDYDDIFYFMENFESTKAVLLVRNYYRLVDEGAVERLLCLFSNECEYDRAGNVLQGKQALEQFYNNDRPLEGEHHILGITAGSTRIRVQGTFIGTSRNKPVVVDFGDKFYFDERLLIVERDTITKNDPSVIN